MNKLKMPRYVQWVLLTGISFLFLMSLLRLFLIFGFEHPPGNTTPFFPVLVLGMRYDLRDVCIACLLMFLIGTIRPLPFEKKSGRGVGFFIWTILVILFVLFYTVDFGNYAYLFQRLRANLLNLLEDTKTSLGLIWENYHVVWITVALIILVIMLLDFISMVYKNVLSKPKLATKRSRIIWGSVFFLLLGMSILESLTNIRCVGATPTVLKTIMRPISPESFQSFSR
jgi:hypothetical protein